MIRAILTDETMIPALQILERMNVKLVTKARAVTTRSITRQGTTKVARAVGAAKYPINIIMTRQVTLMQNAQAAVINASIGIRFFMV